MKVKIFTEGGKSIGYGHLSRCVALYEEIHNRRIEVEMIIHGDMKGLEIIKDIKALNENWLSIEYLNNTLEKGDYVIVDSYIANYEHYVLITLKSKRVLFIDDTGRLEYPKGIIVNPALDSRNVDYTYVTDQRVLTGSKYVILRSAFCAIQDMKIQNTVRKVLVIIGGTDVRDITSEIISNICEQNQDILFHIILNVAQYKRISLCNNLKNVHFHQNLSEVEIYQIMISSDMAISAAGQTIHELLSTQTPFIAIQVAGNQQNNVSSLAEYISPEIVLKYDEVNFIDKLQVKFSEMKDFDFRKNITEKMKDLIDGKGGKRIIDELLSDLNINDEIYVRKAHTDDLKDVYELSNNDYVRKYSINKNRIPWDTHCKWFNDMLQNNNVVFYVVSDENTRFLGQIRYNLEKESATVSLSLSDKIKGKGLSKLILNQTIDRLFIEKPNVNEIIAYVSKNNVASMKIFIGLKFEVIETVDSMLKFILRRIEYYAN